MNLSNFCCEKVWRSGLNFIVCSCLIKRLSVEKVYDVGFFCPLSCKWFITCFHIAWLYGTFMLQVKIKENQAQPLAPFSQPGLDLPPVATLALWKAALQPAHVGQASAPCRWRCDPAGLQEMSGGPRGWGTWLGYLCK